MRAPPDESAAGESSDCASADRASFLCLAGAGAGAGLWKNASGSKTLSTWYTASCPSVYTVFASVALVTPVVTFTAFPEVVTLRSNEPCLPPACVIIGWRGTTWNWTSSTFCWSVNELRIPGLRLEKAESVGAKRVIPWFCELLSCVSIWSATFVVCRRRMNIEYWPDFSRMAVRYPIKQVQFCMDVC
ncbi:auxin response factor 16 [Striga asiatica]|uniref:Auxin response factor 16 n=1 Tax=Striga asiatica TaxID=4170 RepID=A0A5A7R9B3_STRAF|nr:auxin response factor 16 [Striga asiatica]